jgi:hypothetical protein
MFELFFGLVAVYLIYNIIVGSVLALQYYSIEDEVRSNEFWLLWLLPVRGLGIWKYNQIIRWGEVPEHPEGWYKYKYMKNLHWGFVGVYTAVLLYAWLSYDSMVGQGMEAAERSGNVNAIGFGMLFDLGAGLFEGMAFIIVLLFSAIFIKFFIGYPTKKMRAFEQVTYSQNFYKQWNDAKPKNRT